MPSMGLMAPEQHVVAAVELAGLLDRDDVAGVLDHAQHRGVAPVVGADRAQLALGHVEAALAEPDPRLRLGDGPGQPLGVLGGQLQEVEGDALGRLRPDAGQAAELVDQRLDRRGVGEAISRSGPVAEQAARGRRSSTQSRPAPPESPSPPGRPSAPIASAWTAWALRRGVVEGGEHEVLEQLDLGRVDDGRVDAHAQ